jgi:hypothetical protein
VIPTPLHRPNASTRLNVNRRTVQSVKPGESLADVLLRLGEPDEVSLDGRQVAYRWERTWAYWAIGGGYSAVGGPLTRSRALVIDLDDQNRVRAVAVGADNLMSRPETQQVFTPEHGGQNQSAAAAALREAGELKSFRGEPLEFRDSAQLYLDFDAAKLARQGFWRRLGKRPTQPQAGDLFLTSSAMHFKTRGSFGPEPPEWSVTFTNVTGLEIHRVGWGSWLVVRQAGRAPGAEGVTSFAIGTRAEAQAVYGHALRLWAATPRGPAGGAQ